MHTKLSYWNTSITWHVNVVLATPAAFCAGVAMRLKVQATPVVLVQVVAEYRSEQRAVRQQQAESREVERCMERMLSQVAAKEHALDYEVRVVSTQPLQTILLLTSSSTVFSPTQPPTPSFLPPKIPCPCPQGLYCTMV